MDKSTYFFAGALSVLLLSAVPMANEPVERQSPIVDQEVINRYTERTIIAAQVESMNSWTVTLDDGTLLASHVARAQANIGKITLDDGSIWLWNARFEPPLDPLIIGQTITIEWKPHKYLLGVGYGGYYLFLKHDQKKTPIFSQPLLPLALPLKIDHIQLIHHERTREPSLLEAMRGEGDYKITAIVSLSDKSQWLVSLTQSGSTALNDENALAEVGTSAQIVWTSDANQEKQPVIVVQKPIQQRTLIIEATY